MPKKKFSFDKIIESAPCPSCHGVNKIAVDFNDYMQFKIHNYPAEQVFWYLSEAQRERFFGTGICSIECMDKYLGYL